MASSSSAWGTRTYRAAGQLAEGRLLIRSMLAEHVLIRQTAARMSAADNPIEAGAYGRALFEVSTVTSARRMT